VFRQHVLTLPRLVIKQPIRRLNLKKELNKIQTTATRSDWLNSRLHHRSVTAPDRRPKRATRAASNHIFKQQIGNDKGHSFLGSFSLVSQSLTMPKLYAIADLHLSYKFNREALQELTPHPFDSLILAGDIGESAQHLRYAFSTIRPKFQKVWWVPGNHELYTMPSVAAPTNPSPAHLADLDPFFDPADAKDQRGEAKYMQCVALAREYDILTPEDGFEIWDAGAATSGEIDLQPHEAPIPVAIDSSSSTQKNALICPIFTLYDYSFRPPEVLAGDARAWAAEHDLVATDEALLHADPHPSKEAWCAALVARFEARLGAAAERARAEGLKLVIVNHWPLKQRLAFLPSVPRFSIWCGTTLTEEWGRRFGACVVVGGHIHIRRTDWIEGVRYEECSLGYPRQWEGAREMGRDVNAMLREILPGPETPAEASKGGEVPTQWRRYG